MKIHYNSTIAKLFTFLPGFKTIFLFGDVFTEKDSLSDRTIRHESVHSSQYHDLFTAGAIIAAFAFGIWLQLAGFAWGMLGLILIPFLLFYAWYLTEWVVRFIIELVKGESLLDASLTAYRRIAFEQEAKALEESSGDIEDITEPFSFLTYYHK